MAWKLRGSNLNEQAFGVDQARSGSSGVGSAGGGHPSFDGSKLILDARNPTVRKWPHTDRIIYFFWVSRILVMRCPAMRNAG